MQAANDNVPAIARDELWPAMEGEPSRGAPCCINTIAEDAAPHVLRNVAAYYRLKGQTWANHFAGMLMRASGHAPRAANDNRRHARKQRRAA